MDLERSFSHEKRNLRSAVAVEVASKVLPPKAKFKLARRLKIRSDVTEAAPGRGGCCQYAVSSDPRGLVPFFFFSSGLVPLHDSR